MSEQRKQTTARPKRNAKKRALTSLKDSEEEEEDSIFSVGKENKSDATARKDTVSRKGKRHAATLRPKRNAKRAVLKQNTNENGSVDEKEEAIEGMEDVTACKENNGCVVKTRRKNTSSQSKQSTSSARLQRSAKQRALSSVKLTSTSESIDAEIAGETEEFITSYGKGNADDSRDRWARVSRSAASSFVRPVALGKFVTDRRKALDENMRVRKTRPVKGRSNTLNLSDISDAEKLYQECKQDGPLSFEECIPPHKMQSCKKIGEGAFGEVFCTTNNNNEFVALKIIPIEGEQTVNGEMQKKFDEILHEVIISNLHCAKGSYPKPLLKAWDKFDKQRNSENDRPDGLTVSCDISTDEGLFMGQGDYQFEIYRKMREENHNSWSEYNPHTNVLWLHYLTDKLLKMSYKTNPRSHALKETKKNIEQFYRELLQYESATQVLQSCSLFQ
ncbi:Serine/threonine-protein kinase haspin [Acipenser ruthenus]|uniref:non-specific serine/threonine protein kinase n=1 Tax=Acipenser ruthenus TaxID=7906 RepID=A0A444U053_ACIRT|nr:Serine/threonine-protein kinase haspin [Acipenser ruthenus]